MQPTKTNRRIGDAAARKTDLQLARADSFQNSQDYSTRQAFLLRRHVRPALLTALEILAFGEVTQQ
jgi:hypothetical protein